MDKHKELLQTAQALIRERYQKEGHHSVVAAALRTTSGKIYSAINVGTYQPSIATCAEIIAIGMAHTAEPGMEIESIVAVRDEGAYVISPCGKCREYIADYGPNTVVLMPKEQGSDEFIPMPISDLIPGKYCKCEC